MTNKLPELGKRYVNKHTTFFRPTNVADNKIYGEWVSERDGAILSVSDYTIAQCRNFEELPEDKAETKPDEKTMKRKNRILCKICLDIIESKHCHDYITCSCGAISADGGNDYFKRGGKAEDMVDLAFPERLVDVATAAKETINLKKEDEVKVSDVEKKFAGMEPWEIELKLLYPNDEFKKFEFAGEFDKSNSELVDKTLKEQGYYFQSHWQNGQYNSFGELPKFFTVIGKKVKKSANDVEKAKGELRHYMTYPDLSDEATQWHRLFKKAQALLDALDAEKK